MKLSDISYMELFTKYNNKKDLQDIVFDTEYSKSENKTDFGIVFGGISMIPYRVDEALRLYKENLIDKLVLTGGIGFLNKDRNMPEALKMRDYLLKHDIPDSDIIVESQSRSTYENIYLFLQILKKQYNLNETTFTLITSDFHIRRCMAMVQKLLNEEAKLFGNVAKDHITDIDSWYTNLYGRRMILQEAFLLCYCAKKGIAKNLELTLKK